MVMSRMLTASVLVLGALAAQDCGEGFGDLREVATTKSACNACHGTLSYDNSAADGLGYTSCSGRHAPQQESSAPAPCGAGIGDLREVAATKSACDACHGTLSYDNSAADGLGYTSCSGGHESSAPAPCGAGIGDLREVAATKSACDACHGTLSYDNSAADGLGYTACSKSSTPQPQQQFQLTVACGEGVGDLTQVTAAQSACEACSGILVFGPLAAGGVGYTACVTGGLNDEPAVQEQKTATADFRVGSGEFKVLLSMLLFFALVFSCHIMRNSSSRELAAQPVEERVAAPSEKEAAETEASCDKAQAKLADLYAKV